MAMLAGEVRTAALCALREHAATARLASPLGYAGLADFDGLVVRGFDQFPSEGRGLFSVSENGD
jgi:hypothetical protein